VLKFYATNEAISLKMYLLGAMRQTQPDHMMNTVQTWQPGNKASSTSPDHFTIRQLLLRYRAEISQCRELRPESGPA